MFPFPFAGDLLRYVDELPTREHHVALAEACEVFSALADAFAQHADMSPDDSLSLREAAIHLRQANRNFRACADARDTLRPPENRPPETATNGPRGHYSPPILCRMTAVEVSHEEREHARKQR